MAKQSRGRRRTKQSAVEDLRRLLAATELLPTSASSPTPTYLPFHSVRTVEPGETVVVVAQPQILFKGRQLYIPLSCADFALLDVAVGSNSQVAACGPAPAEAFAACCAGRLYDLTTRVLESARPVLGIGLGGAPGGRHSKGPTSDLRAGTVPEDARADIALTGRPLGMQTAQVAMNVSLEVRNDGAQPAIFRAIVFGDGVE